MTEETFWSILVVLWIVTAITVTIFPVAYLLSNWWETPEGRAVMARSATLALLVDETVIFYFWDIENVMVKYTVQAVTLSAVIASAVYLAWVLIRTQIKQIRWLPPSEPHQSGTDHADLLR